MNTITATDMRHDYALATNREQVLEWVREHRLDPNDVWSIATWGPLLLAYVYLRDRDGNKRLRGKDRIRMRLRVRWLRRPFPVSEEASDG